MRCLGVYYISRLYVELKAQCILERLPYRRIAQREKSALVSRLDGARVRKNAGNRECLRKWELPNAVSVNETGPARGAGACLLDFCILFALFGTTSWDTRP